LHTRICDIFGIEFPIVSAGMGGIAGAQLAAAVSEAGGLGTLGLAAFGREGIMHEIAAAQAQTKKPLAANLLVPFLRPGIVETVADAGLAAVTFFWGDAREYRDAISTLHATGARVIWQCGTVDEARWAVDAGVDIIIPRVSRQAAMFAGKPPRSPLSRRCVMRYRTHRCWLRAVSQTAAGWLLR
jgi:nitronate monooxygenase